MAVAPRTPLIAPKPAEGSRGTHAARSTVAITITTAPATSWLRASGRKPADSGIWARAAKRAPKPSPASTPSTAPEPRGPPPASSGAALARPARCRGGPRRSRARPGPRDARRWRRRPRPAPALAPTPETGATTPIRPDERPRYRKPVPMPLATPATSAQRRSRAVGSPPTTPARARTSRPPASCATSATLQGLARLEVTPPTKSESPYAAAEAERQQDRGHVTTTPTTQTAAASRPGRQLDEDAQADGPQCRPRRGAGRGGADAATLGEVEPEHEAEEQAEDRDHEEADDAERHAGPLGRRRDAGVLEAAARARRTSRPCRRRAARPRRRATTQPVALAEVDGPHHDRDQHEQHAGQQRDQDPGQSHRDGERDDDLHPAHGVTVAQPVTPGRPGTTAAPDRVVRGRVVVWVGSGVVAGRRRPSCRRACGSRPGRRPRSP